MSDAARDAEVGRLVDVGPVGLWVDHREPAGSPAEGGGPRAPGPVVLVSPADSPGFRWTPAIVDPLLAAGHSVVRYDHRDCGRSTRPAADAVYDLDDLAADLVALLDRLGLDAVHLVGRSMGAMVAQVVALEHPHRVRSLVLVGSTPGAGDPRLPGPDDAFVDAMAERLFAGPPAAAVDRAAWIVEGYRLMAGTRYPFEAATQAELAAAEVATGWAPESGHGVAVHASPPRLDRLGGIEAPTLVVHGTADPVFPPEHGRMLATRIPGADLVEVEGLGHELPDAAAVELVPLLLRHLARA